jgi:hypothetical protein
VFADDLALEIDRAPKQHLDYLARQSGRIGDRRARRLALIALEILAFEKPRSGRIPN